MHLLSRRPAQVQRASHGPRECRLCIILRSFYITLFFCVRCFFFFRFFSSVCVSSSIGGLSSRVDTRPRAQGSTKCPGNDATKRVMQCKCVPKICARRAVGPRSSRNGKKKTTMKVRRVKDGRGAGRGGSSHRNLCKEFVSRFREESALFGALTNPPPPRVLAAANQWGNIRNSVVS